MKMKISKAMIAQIAEFEGCRLTAYCDVAGIPTIGIGHTGDDVQMGDKISLDEAYRLFAEDIAHFEDVINKLDRETMPKSDIYGGFSQRQFDALVSLVYNCGGSAVGNNSTLRKIFKSGCRCHYAEITHAFMLWVKTTDPVTKQKVVCGGSDGKHGLVLRRATEAAWFVFGENYKEEMAHRGITDIVEWARN